MSTDNRVIELKKQVESELNKLAEPKEKPTTNLIFSLFGQISVNLNVMSVDDLKLFHNLIGSLNPVIKIGRWTVQDYMNDAGLLIDKKSYSARKAELEAKLVQLSAHLSQTAKTEEFLSNFEI